MKQNFQIALYILLASFCSAQNFEWARLIKPASGSNFAGMNIMYAKDGNVYAGGNFQGTIDLGNGHLLTGNNDAFVAKFDSSGACQWATQIYVTTGGCGCGTGPTPNASYVRMAGFDSQGNLIVTGSFCGCGATFGNGVTSSGLAANLFLAKYNASGQCLWVQTKPSTSNDLIFDLCSDEQDNMYISILNKASGVNFCGLTLPNQADYLLKINANGVGVWSKMTMTSSGGNNSYVMRNFNCRRDRIYCSGLFLATTVLGPNTFTANGVNDAFVAVMDTSGTILNSSVISGGGAESPFGLEVIGNKFCILEQTNSSSISAGTYTLNTGTGQDKSFLVAYDTNLNVLNARKTSTDSMTTAVGLYSDKFGGFYVLAQNNNTADFGNLTNVPPGRNIIRMDANLNNLWYLQNDGGCAAPDTLGNVYIVDNFYNSAAYGTLSNTTTGLGITLGKIQNAITNVGSPAGRQQNNMGVYPNPGDGVFNLKVNSGIKNKKEITITLFDAQGKQIENIPFTQRDDYTLQINLSSYEKGMYMVKVLADGTYYSAKLER